MGKARAAEVNGQDDTGVHSYFVASLGFGLKPCDARAREPSSFAVLLSWCVSGVQVYPPPSSWVACEPPGSKALTTSSPGEPSPPRGRGRPREGVLHMGVARAQCDRVTWRGVSWWHQGETEVSLRSTGLSPQVPRGNMVALQGHAALRPLRKGSWLPYSVLAGNLVPALPGLRSPSPWTTLPTSPWPRLPTSHLPLISLG